MNHLAHFALAQASDDLMLGGFLGDFVKGPLRGERPAGISKWSFSTSATLSHRFSDSFEAYLRGEYDYASKVPLSETTPPGISTYGLSNVNASLGLILTKPRIEVMLWARNLTNHESLITSFPTVAQDGSFSGFPIQPRTYGVTARKKF